MFINVKHFFLAPLSILLVILFSVSCLAAEDTGAILDRAKTLYKAGKFAAAYAELDWAQKNLASIITKDVAAMLPTKLAGFTMQDRQQGNVLGLSEIARRFSKNDGSVTIDIKVITSLGSQSSGMGALMKMTQWAQSMNVSNGTMEPVRISGKRGQLSIEATRNRGRVTFALQNDVMVLVEGKGQVNKEVLETVAKKLDLSKIESYFAKE